MVCISTFGSPPRLGSRTYRLAKVLLFLPIPVPWVIPAGLRAFHRRLRIVAQLRVLVHHLSMRGSGDVHGSDGHQAGCRRSGPARSRCPQHRWPQGKARQMGHAVRNEDGRMMCAAPVEERYDGGNEAIIRGGLAVACVTVSVHTRPAYPPWACDGGPDVLRLAYAQRAPYW